MALKVWDGFDHYNNGADWKERSGFLQYQQPAVNAPGITFVTGRNGFGKALQITSGQFSVNGVSAVFQDRNADALVGFGYQFGATTSACGSKFRFVDTVSLVSTITQGTQVTVYFDEFNYSILVYRGDLDDGSAVLIYASPNNVWARNVWNFVEIEVKIDNTVGFVKVNVNGVQKVNATGLDTQRTGNAWWDAMWIQTTPGGISNSPVAVIDDLYYCDKVVGPGTFPADTFLGDAKVVTLFATGNDAVQWTPLSGTNWQMIDEQAMDSDTSYNFSTTPGFQDTFVFQALAGTITTIYGVQVTYATRKDDAGMRVVKSVVKSGGTSYFGANNSLPDTTYVYFTDAWILDPDTGANWTLTGVNSADYGYNMVS